VSAELDEFKAASYQVTNGKFVAQSDVVCRRRSSANGKDGFCSDVCKYDYHALKRVKALLKRAGIADFDRLVKQVCV
jgi:hypothetical protein